LHRRTARRALYSPDRSGETPRKLLGGKRGKLLVDGYTGYNRVCDVEGRDRAGCLAHRRRHFFEALSTAKAEGLLLCLAGCFVPVNGSLEM